MDTDQNTTTDDVVIDETVRYKGKVSKFDRRRGFGSIIPDGKGEDDKIFAHWRQIESSDEWPALKEGMVVEYYVGKKESGKRKSQKEFAAKITLEGGNPVSVSEERTYPNRAQRFQGKVKFFDARKGFGFVNPASDFSFDGTDFKAENGNIHISREDIKTTADIAPSLKDGQEIEFTLFKTSDDDKKYAAGDVTKVGGEAFAEDELATKKTGWPRKRRFNNKGGKNKGGFGNIKFPKGFNMGQMGGFGGMFMMNGMPYMMMPVQGGKKKRGGKGRW